MSDGIIYRGFDIGRGEDRSVWLVRRNGERLGTFNSEDEAMSFCDRLKREASQASSSSSE